MSEVISRQDAKDAIDMALDHIDHVPPWVYDNLLNALNEVPSAETERHGRIFQEIVVEYPSISTYPEYEGKPYFSIKYTEDGQGIIGYGTYKPEVLSEYLKKYFMQSAGPEIIRCKDCENWDTSWKPTTSSGKSHYCALKDGVWEPDDYCSYAERRQ